MYQADQSQSGCAKLNGVIAVQSFTELTGIYFNGSPQNNQNMRSEKTNQRNNQTTGKYAGGVLRVGEEHK